MKFKNFKRVALSDIDFKNGRGWFKILHLNNINIKFISTSEIESCKIIIFDDGKEEKYYIKEKKRRPRQYKTCK
ncbi:hypothetical protein [Candidatus Phytoplasma sp. AldY-WA1]|uniref:hypothetical protein n=1 Tax=Candidatus Phytoplasma sp. AldY-WA1 TaxID=2852100 RepID=UPI00254BED84|nr:hypothetical protein [Candidatus Phytoplasma sp. AldY-WA1]